MPAGLIFKDTHFSSCCRSRLADFFTNCQPESRSVSSCLKENYADCLLAYSGLIGKKAGKGGGLFVLRETPKLCFEGPHEIKTIEYSTLQYDSRQNSPPECIGPVLPHRGPGANLYIARKLRIEDKERKVLEFEINSSL